MKPTPARCRKALCVAALFSLFTITPCSAQLPAAAPRPANAKSEDWPGFRGPGRRGVSADKYLPREWNATKGVVWKAPLPGPGASSPITFRDHIYLTCYSGYGLSREAPGNISDLKRHVLCLARNDGKLRWSVTIPYKVPDDHYGSYIDRHGYASSTPAADETGVYVFFGTAGAFAYTHDGALKWQQSCGTKHGNFGSAASPVLTSDSVIINADVESKALIALDKKTGRKIWRVATDADARSTPLLLETGVHESWFFTSRAIISPAQRVASSPPSIRKRVTCFGNARHSTIISIPVPSPTAA